jgi:heptaprenyl diphosphate synthase
MAGAIFHNTGQILVAAALLREMIIIYYLPVLLVSALITGFITGSIAEIAIKEAKEKGIFPDEF